MNRRGLLAGLPLLLGAPWLARAQESWPNRAIRLIAGSAAGGSVDAAARILAPRLSALLNGVPVVVENRGGAGGTLAFDPVARAQPDGYTLVLTHTGALVLSPLLQPELNLRPFEEMTPVSLVCDVMTVLVTPADKPWNSLAELLAAARARPPGALSWGYPGAGTSQWLATLLLERAAGITTTGVPYRGGAPAMLDLLAGRLDFMFATTPTALPNLQTGKLKALAVPTGQRIPILPDVPTVAELGHPGFDLRSWYGILATTGTPRPVIERLNAAINTALRDPLAAQALLEMGMSPQGSTPEEFLSQAATVRDRFGPIALAGVQRL